MSDAQIQAIKDVFKMTPRLSMDCLNSIKILSPSSSISLNSIVFMSSKLDLQTTMDVAANIKANTGKTGIDLENAVIDAEIRTRNPNMQNTIVDMEGRINASSSQADVIRNIEASLSNAGVSKQTIDSVINTEVKQVYDQGGTVTSADAGRIVKEAHKRDLPSDVKENARQASSLLS